MKNINNYNNNNNIHFGYLASFVGFGFGSVRFYHSRNLRNIRKYNRSKDLLLLQELVKKSKLNNLKSYSTVKWPSLPCKSLLPFNAVTVTENKLTTTSTFTKPELSVNELSHLLYSKQAKAIASSKGKSIEFSLNNKRFKHYRNFRKITDSKGTFIYCCVSKRGFPALSSELNSSYTKVPEGYLDLLFKNSFESFFNKIISTHFKPVNINELKYLITNFSKLIFTSVNYRLDKATIEDFNDFNIAEVFQVKARDPYLTNPAKEKYTVNDLSSFKDFKKKKPQTVYKIYPAVSSFYMNPSLTPSYFSNLETNKFYYNYIKRFLDLLDNHVFSAYIVKAVPLLLEGLNYIYKFDVRNAGGYVIFHQSILTIFYRIIITIQKQHELSVRVFNTEEEIDFYTDLKTLKDRVYKLLQNEIKDHLHVPGISLTTNKFVGWDTEYEAFDASKNLNSLLSSQLASNHNCYIKIPTRNKFVISGTSINKWLNGLDTDSRYFSSTITDPLIDCIITNTEIIRDLTSFEKDSFYKQLQLYLNKIHSEYSLLHCFREDLRFKLIKHKNSLMLKTVDSHTESLFKTLNLYSWNDLLTDINNLHNNASVQNANKLLKILNNFIIDTDTETVKKPNFNKSKGRFKYNIDKTFSIQVSFNNIVYLCLHETSADLSMLSDFEHIKTNFDIVKRSFVTRSKPLTLSKNTEENWPFKLHVRDTALIAPAGVKSLKALGEIHGDSFKKIDIGLYRAGDMRSLLKENPVLFEEYAMRDSLITLKHSNSMEDFYVDYGKSGVPLSLSSVSKASVIKFWDSIGYNGYNIRKDIPLGSLGNHVSPKNLRVFDLMETFLKYTKSYRGGRNESFVYGKVVSNYIADVDLVSAYTSVLSMVGDPDYKNYVNIKSYQYAELFELADREFFTNYYIMKVEFKFPKKCLYPCIPVTVDDDVEAYVREGVSLITGPEFVAARNAGCNLKILEAHKIPFSKNPSPFIGLIKDLQGKRKLYPKKTFYNYMYKELGNSIYGLISMGLNVKKAYDTKTGTYQRVNGGELSNPVIASYITGFCRAVIGESLINIQKLNGSVYSVTTDGFTTNVQDLEQLLISKIPTEKTSCLRHYRRFRGLLTGNILGSEAYEIKTTLKDDMLSWKTRGQLAKEPGTISAATGFQKTGIEHNFLYETFENIILKEPSKMFTYIQTRLRGASDCFKDNAQVQVVNTDQQYTLSYDNKRCIIDNNDATLLQTKPWQNVTNLLSIRVLKKALSTQVYGDYLLQSQNKYKNSIDTAVRSFIKIWLNEEHRKEFNIKVTFNSYKDIKRYVESFNDSALFDSLKHPETVVKSVCYSTDAISKLKTRKSIFKSVRYDRQTKTFIDFIKIKNPDFDETKFFKTFKQNK